MDKLSLTGLPIAAAESKSEFLQLMAIVAQGYEPCNAYELFLVTRMTAILWRIQRLEKHMAEVIASGRAQLSSGRRPNSDARVSKYMPYGVGREEIREADLERRLYQSLNDLRKEFHSSRVRRVSDAAYLNEAPGYKIGNQAQSLLTENELSELRMFDLALQDSTAE